jgi:acetate---CoA ligase (ADP-forming)
MNIIDTMKKFLEPESIAIIGATRKTGEFSMNIMGHLLSYGYKGRMYPVNPNATEILGIKSYADIKDIPEAADLALIVTSRETVPANVEHCAARGIKCVAIVGQGFNDSGDEEGKLLYKQLNDVIGRTGVRVLGPNTFGSANAFINFSTSFARITLDPNPVGIISQSGTFFHGYPEFRLLGKAIDLGNNCDIDFEDGLAYYEQDPQVKVIGLHIEGMKNPRRFLDTARRVALKKPIVVLKTGRSAQAARAMQSHTGSLAGDSIIWDSALKSAGLIVVNGLEEFFDTVRMFTITPLMKNNRIAIATYSGASGILMMDALHDSGLEICKLPAKTAAKLEGLAPSWLRVTNPVDYWPIMMGHPDQGAAMRDVMETLLEDEYIGGVLYTQVAFTKPFAEGLTMFVNYLGEKYPQRPFISSIPGTFNMDCLPQIQRDGKHSAMPSPERAARAITRLWQYSKLLGL